MALERVKDNKPPTKDEIKGRLIFSPIMIALGLAIFIFASLPKLQKAKESKTWLPTKGKITEVQIVAHKDGTECVLGRKNPLRYRGDEGVKFRVETRYTFQVEDSTYSSKKRHLMQQKTDGEKKYRRAEMKKNYYTNHDDVTVFYNPVNPEEAVLRQGLHPGSWLLVVSPVLLPVIGLLLLISVIRAKLRN